MPGCFAVCRPPDTADRREPPSRRWSWRQRTGRPIFSPMPPASSPSITGTGSDLTLSPPGNRPKRDTSRTSCGGSSSNRRASHREAALPERVWNPDGCRPKPVPLRTGTFLRTLPPLRRARHMRPPLRGIMAGFRILGGGSSLRRSPCDAPASLRLTSLPESSARIPLPRLLRPWCAPLRGCLRPGTLGDAGGSTRRGDTPGGCR